ACIKEGFRTRRRTFLIGVGGSVITTIVTGALINEILLGNETKRHPLPLIALPYTYHGHTAPVNSVAWSPDGTHIASDSSDRTVQVWDASTAGLLQTYKGHADAVLSVVWSPDSSQIASASADKTVQVWDASSGNLLLSYHGHTAPVNSVAWSPDGKRIAS